MSNSTENRLNLDLNFDALPDLPQLRPLREFAPRLWARPDALALWIGGSIGRGSADRYSDVDLRIAVRAEAFEEWQRAEIQTLIGNSVVAQTRLSFGEHAFLHHVVLTTGDIYDIWIQSEDHAVGADTILIVGCRDEKLRSHLNACRQAAPAPDLPASSDTVRQMLVEFWINTHKHRKVLDRNLHLLAIVGAQNDRAVLLRLWYMEITGLDAGNPRTQTIHGLAHQMRTVEQAKGAEALRVLGASLASRADILTAIEMLRDEIGHTGRLLAARLDFAYPAEVEAVARQGWQEFQASRGETNSVEQQRNKTI